jgi:hypothetical protein
MTETTAPVDVDQLRAEVQAEQRAGGGRPDRRPSLPHRPGPRSTAWLPALALTVRRGCRGGQCPQEADLHDA